MVFIVSDKGYDDPFEELSRFLAGIVLENEISVKEIVYVINEYIKWKESSYGSDFHELLWDVDGPNTFEKIDQLKRENLYLSSLNEYGGQ